MSLKREFGRESGEGVECTMSPEPLKLCVLQITISQQKEIFFKKRYSQRINHGDLHASAVNVGGKGDTGERTKEKNKGANFNVISLLSVSTC
jgi:hypothetical protein